jgi:hypothetical protein
LPLLSGEDVYKERKMTLAGSKIMFRPKTLLDSLHKSTDSSAGMRVDLFVYNIAMKCFVVETF